jgi:hypothetical protein
MGLLDDAIREHLELKRRRGADPAEIERAERDALGPARREPEPFEPAEDQYETAHEGFADPVPWEGDGPQVVGPEQPDTEAHWHEGEHGPSADASHFETGEEEGHVYRELEETAAGAEPADQREPVFGPAEYQHDPPPPSGTELPVEEPRDATVEYSVDDRLEAGEVPPHQVEAEEDVLEETPDFLQDTPDHDRLWFEQRPPRDFDFGG